MLKNKVKLLISVTACLIIFSVTVLASTPNPVINKNIINVADKINTMKILNNKQNDNLIAEVNGEKIFKVDLDKQRLFRTDSISDKDLLDIMINNKILFKKGEEEGLTPTNEELNNYVQAARTSIKNNASEQDKQMITDIIKAYGISEDDYWSNYVPKVYKISITIGKLKQKIKDSSTVGIEDPKLKESTYKDSLNKEINRFKISSDIKIY